MKKSELKMLVRTIVREEVAMAIQEVVVEMKEPITKEVQPTAKRQSTNNLKSKRIVEKKKYTKNSVLNDILNETANDDGWDTMGGELFSSNQVNDVLKRRYSGMMGNAPEAQLPDEDINGQVVANVSETLMGNLTKDYSGVLKSMKKTADRNRGI